MFASVGVSGLVAAKSNSGRAPFAATNGQVTRRDLRPADWHLIWPELADARLARADIFSAQPQQEAGHAQL